MAGTKGHRGWGRLRRCSSGRWQASYIAGGVRHNAPHTFTAKMDGEGWLCSERLLVERGAWTPPSTRSAAANAAGITVARYVKAWIDGRDLKPGPRYDYRLKLAKFIEAKPIGGVPLSALTPLIVRNWYDALDSGKPSARAAVYSMLSTVLKSAVRDGYLSVNPVDIEGARTARKQRRNVLPTPAEVAQIADSIAPRLRAWVLVGHWLGVRIGEACELRRADVDLDANVIHVRRGMRHIGKDCHISSTKNGEERTVTIPSHIVADLRRHMMEYVGAQDDALVFAPVNASRCGHLSQDHMRHALKTALASVPGRESMVAHDMRHFAGTAATASGASQAEVQQRLGHKDHRSAAIYQHVLDGRDVAVAAALSRLATA